MSILGARKSCIRQLWPATQSVIPRRNYKSSFCISTSYRKRWIFGRQEEDCNYSCLLNPQCLSIPSLSIPTHRIWESHRTFRPLSRCDHLSDLRTEVQMLEKRFSYGTENHPKGVHIIHRMQSRIDSLRCQTSEKTSLLHWHTRFDSGVKGKTGSGRIVFTCLRRWINNLFKCMTDSSAYITFPPPKRPSQLCPIHKPYSCPQNYSTVLFSHTRDTLFFYDYYFRVLWFHLTCFPILPLNVHMRFSLFCHSMLSA